MDTQETVGSSTINPTATQEFVESHHLFEIPVEYILITFHVVVIFLGISGNSMVCYLFASKKVRRTSFNVLLLNLSVADLLADLFVIPYIVVDLKLLRHLSSRNANLVCAFTISLTPFWAVTTVSLFSLCFISLTRYLQLRCSAVHSRITSRRGITIFIIIIWLLSLGLPVPNLFSFKYDPKTAICHRSWPRGFRGVIYCETVSALAIFLPSVSMISTFLLTVRTYSKLRAKQDTVESDSITKPLLSNVMVKRRSAVRLLGSLIIVFIVFWCPFFFYWVLSEAAPKVFPNGKSGDYTRLKVIRCCILAAMCNTVADPLVYALRGEEFQRAIKDTIQRMRCRVFGRKLSTV